MCVLSLCSIVVSDLKIPAREEVTDEVNVKQFWHSIENTVLLRGISNGNCLSHHDPGHIHTQ